EPLGPVTAREIWEEANRQLPQLPARTLLERFDVQVVATTDDPTDDLGAHEAPALIPTFRPDAAHALLGDPPAWNAWARRLGGVEDLESLLGGLTRAYERFTAAGGRASDHGLSLLPDVERDPALADATVVLARAGEPAGDEGRDAVMLEVVCHTA